MGLNNLSIEEKRAWYSAQIQRLRDRKIDVYKRQHQVHAALWGLRQYDAALHIFNNVSHISANVLKLFPNRLPNYLCAVLLPLHQIQIVFSGPFSIHSGLLQHVAVTHLVYDTLNLFSDTVQ